MLRKWFSYNSTIYSNYLCTRSYNYRYQTFLLSVEIFHLCPSFMFFFLFFFLNYPRAHDIKNPSRDFPLDRVICLRARRFPGKTGRSGPISLVFYFRQSDLRLSFLPTRTTTTKARISRATRKFVDVVRELCNRSLHLTAHSRDLNRC